MRFEINNLVKHVIVATVNCLRWYLIRYTLACGLFDESNNHGPRAGLGNQPHREA